MNQISDMKTLLQSAPPIPDTKGERDERHIAIQRVGVKDVRYPLQIRVQGKTAHTVAQWDLDVALPAEKKGTHMSRFVVWLDALNTPMGRLEMSDGLARMLEALHASEGRIEARFPFFIRKRTPVSGQESLLEYQGKWIAECRAGVTRISAEVTVPVQSLCP